MSKNTVSSSPCSRTSHDVNAVGLQCSDERVSRDGSTNFRIGSLPMVESSRK